MEVDWSKCKGGIWCMLNNIDLDHKNLRNVEGVYIIWAEPEEGRLIIKVGKGDISDELKEARVEHAVQAFTNYTLFATWAEVSSLRRAGVELYLSKTLNPKIASNAKAAFATEVNLPW
ncbi:MAG: hypothetical protein QG635_507 [Bacteroidota bacterium]|nr:hypothetical protein [Bacteroidota bacterium]